MLNMFAAMAQFEREMMLERQREGIAKCFDRMDGKVTQSVDTSGQVRGDVTFTWKRPAK
jgi:hypothetical protein